MKPIKLTEFDVKEQIPVPLRQGGVVTKNNFSPDRRLAGLPASANPSAQKSLHLGASIAIMGPQMTKTITQNLQSSQNPTPATRSPVR